ncbi:MAG TPA: hypothetical protein DF715_08440 [Oceanicaulis sp.]|uniref:SAM-dependent methyltransferase n=1 Tax=Glycocaulis albus TaxID=1382801 RepID=A0ABQ1XQ07_9PROT|nr:DUF938 domain-containing protein [Glycocaulis albus]MBV5257453.1 DUF938 domain-containing protein [Synechococcus moorigangaii CMS01]GGH00019.1 SAM-dependent methyltransferase [Glycocaulis albus]HCY55538.1 hypothetical protein [Oceanicaulis sp.]
MTGSSPIALEDRGQTGARMSSPSAGRNRDVIAAALASVLPQGSRVLEIASGTGEHALACVTERTDLHWQPSDPDPASRASIDDWAREAGGRIAPALDLDTQQSGWWQAVPLPLSAVFCANMIHIAPWEAAEGLVAGSAALLEESGQLVLYGPFLEGDATAPSNLAFDASLKSRDPRWGVRARDEVEALAASCGFALTQRLDMPANNLVLVFVKGAP